MRSGTKQKKNSQSLAAITHTHTDIFKYGFLALEQKVLSAIFVP